MDLDVIAKLLERTSLRSSSTLRFTPWWLGEVRPRRPVRRSRLLASLCPRGPNVGADVDLEAPLLRAFLPEDRGTIARQIEEGYRHLIVLSGEIAKAGDEAAVVHQLVCSHGPRPEASARGHGQALR